MAETEIQQQTTTRYLIRVVDHEGRPWYLGTRENIGTDLLHPSEMDEEHCPAPIIHEPCPPGVINAAPLTIRYGVRDGHIPWRSFELYEDYAEALERMTRMQDVGFIVPPPLMAPLDEDFSISKLKFDLLVERCNPVYQVDTGVASAALMTFHSNVFIELCSTRFEVNPEHEQKVWDEQLKAHYIMKSGEAYRIHALIRYPLTYRRTRDEVRPHASE